MQTLLACRLWNSVFTFVNYRQDSHCRGKGYLLLKLVCMGRAWMKTPAHGQSRRRTTPGGPSRGWATGAWPCYPQCDHPNLSPRKYAHLQTTTWLFCTPGRFPWAHRWPSTLFQFAEIISLLCGSTRSHSIKVVEMRSTVKFTGMIFTQNHLVSVFSSLLLSAQLPWLFTASTGLRFESGTQIVSVLSLFLPWRLHPFPHLLTFPR